MIENIRKYVLIQDILHIWDCLAHMIITDFAGLFVWIIVLFISCVCHAYTSINCCLVVACWGVYLLTLVCDVYLYFCHFRMWYPGSGVVLDCVDS